MHDNCYHSSIDSNSDNSCSDFDQIGLPHLVPTPGPDPGPDSASAAHDTIGSSYGSEIGNFFCNNYMLGTDDNPVQIAVHSVTPRTHA